MPEASPQPVFRFAPSPNGLLHLGHARSALLNADLARASGGRFLLRIEDIDLERARPEFEAAIYEDLAWLGLDWERPVRRQSEHFGDYESALERLEAMGLLYGCYCSRGDIAQAVAGRPDWPRDPDGSPRYPGTCLALTDEDRAARRFSGQYGARRLHMGRALARVDAPVAWREYGDEAEPRVVRAEPGVWGDVALARKDVPTSYHLAVVVDDALQGVTDVVRGADLMPATSLHRLLQILLDLPAPDYRHHSLVLDAEGRKLSKSSASTSLRALRAQGVTPAQIRLMAGLAPAG
ncbi:MAG: tRNA glutamyl-Q(34) synthetase GluQRS [Methylobacteriaceae bacterium]|nr:tRNA glutamyl-Q(34) synthetase GluQRS [Methylobacteriaceae bacterium]